MESQAKGQTHEKVIFGSVAMVTKVSDAACAVFIKYGIELFPLVFDRIHVNMEKEAHQVMSGSSRPLAEQLQALSFRQYLTADADAAKGRSRNHDESQGELNLIKK